MSRSPGRIWLLVLAAVALTVLIASGVLVSPGPFSSGEDAELDALDPRSLGADAEEAAASNAARLHGATPLGIEREGGIRGRLLRGGQGVGGALRIWAVVRLERREPLEWLGSQPLAGRLKRIHGSRPMVRLRTAQDGAFRLPPLARGAYYIVAQHANQRTGRILQVSGTDDAQYLRLELPSASTRLVGRVTTTRGEPWIGYVGIITRGNTSRGEFEPRPFSGPTARTDDDGRFVLEGVRVGRVDVVCYQPDRFMSAPTTVWAPSRAAVSIRVAETPRRITGLIRSSADLSPLANAEIIVAIESSRYRARSDAHGRYVIQIPTGSWTEWFVRAEGYTSRWLDPAQASNEVDVLLSPPGRVSGVVVDVETGEPRVGLRLELWRRDASASFRDGGVATTDGQGRFEVPVLAAGPYQVRVVGSTYVVSSVNGGDPGSNGFHVGPNEEAALRIDVREGRSLNGRVLTKSGEVVAGAQVYVYPRGDAAWAHLTAHLTTADRNGHFTLRGLTSGREHWITAHAAGHMAGGVLLAVDPVAPVEIVLQPEQWIDLRVLDSTDKPVRPCSAHFEKMDASRTLFGDEAGRIRVGPFAPTRSLTVSVSAPGYIRQEVTIDPLTAKIHDVSLRAGMEIRGRALFRDGEPVRDCRLDLVGASGSHTSYSEEDGSFVLDELEPGRYTLRCVAWVGIEEERHIVSLEVQAGEQDVELRFESTAPPASEDELAEPDQFVELLVLTPEGQPVPSAEVDIEREPDGWSATVTAGRTMIPADSEAFVVDHARDASGRPLPLRPYRAESMPAGSPPFRVTLQPGLTIEGRVVDDQGRPVARVHVFVSTPYRRARTDNRGRFRLTQLEPGWHAIGCSPGLHYSRPEPLDIRAGSTDVEIRVEPADLVTIRVVDPDGEPIKHAMVQVRNSAELRARPTDLAGRVVFTNLPRRQLYSLTVTPPRPTRGLVGRSLASWSPQDEVIALARGLEVRGTVLDASGRAVVGAEVLARQGQGSSRAITTDEGAFRLVGFLPGSVSISTLPLPERLPQTGERPAILHGLEPVSLEVEAGTTGHRLRLPRPRTLRIQVVDWPQAARLNRVSFFAMSKEGRAKHLATTSLDREGGAQAIGPRSDVVYAAITEPLPDGRYGFAEGIRLGEAPARLTLRAGHTIEGRVEGGPATPRDAVQVVVSGEYASRRVHVHPDRTFRIDGLPPGRYRMRAEYTDVHEREEIYYMGRTTADTGDVVVIRMNRQP